MIVLVTGGREFRNQRLMWAVLDRLHEEHGFTYLVHGDAAGADHMAHRWAKKHGVQPVAMEALWEYEGDPAGPRRNGRMLEFAKPQMVVAFPGQTGTTDMVKKTFDARKAGKDIIFIDVEDYALKLRL